MDEADLVPLREKLSLAWQVFETHEGQFRDDTYVQRWQTSLADLIQSSPRAFQILRIGESLPGLWSRCQDRDRYGDAIWGFYLALSRAGGQHLVRLDMEALVSSPAFNVSSDMHLSLLDELLPHAQVSESVLLSIVGQLVDTLNGPAPNNIFWQRNCHKILIQSCQMFLKSSQCGGLFSSLPDKTLTLVFRAVLIWLLDEDPMVQELIRKQKPFHELRDRCEANVACALLTRSIFDKETVHPFVRERMEGITDKEDFKSLLPVVSIIEKCYPDVGVTVSESLEGIRASQSNAWKAEIIFRFMPDVVKRMKDDTVRLWLEAILNGDHDLTSQGLSQLLQALLNSLDHGTNWKIYPYRAMTRVLGRMAQSREFSVQDRVRCLRTYGHSWRYSHNHRLEDMWILATNDNWEIVHEFLVILRDSVIKIVEKDEQDRVVNLLRKSLSSEESFIRAEVFLVLKSAPWAWTALGSTGPEMCTAVWNIFDNEPEAIVRRSAAEFICHCASSPKIEGLKHCDLLLKAVLDLDWEVKEIALTSFWKGFIQDSVALNPLPVAEMIENHTFNVLMFILSDHDKRYRKDFLPPLKLLQSSLEKKNGSSNQNGLASPDKEGNSDSKRRKLDSSPNREVILDGVLKHTDKEILLQQATHPKTEVKTLSELPRNVSYEVFQKTLSTIDLGSWANEFQEQWELHSGLEAILDDIINCNPDEDETNMIDCV